MFVGNTKPTAMEVLFKNLGSSDPDKRYHALMDAQGLTAQQMLEMVQASKQWERRASRRNRKRPPPVCSCEQPMLQFHRGNCCDLP